MIRFRWRMLGRLIRFHGQKDEALKILHDLTRKSRATLHRRDTLGPHLSWVWAIEGGAQWLEQGYREHEGFNIGPSASIRCLLRCTATRDSKRSRRRLFRRGNLQRP